MHEVSYYLRYWLRQNGLDPDNYSCTVTAKTTEALYDLERAVKYELSDAQLDGSGMGRWPATMTYEGIKWTFRRPA